MDSFGEVFTLTTWGESHGEMIGGVIDGCPSGFLLDFEHIQEALNLRAPGKDASVTQRKEPDKVVFVSGVWEGKTTGTPLAFYILNEDKKSKEYPKPYEGYRPGHAHFSYEKKYGIFDHRGGGRASARETALRVVAGAIAEQFLEEVGISIHAALDSVGPLSREAGEELFLSSYPAYLEEMADRGDSVGGVVSFLGEGIPPGLGEPIYNKFSARLGFGMLSIPGVKGFEIGRGREASLMQGSSHNDFWGIEENAVKALKNDAGGVLGGITTGEPVYGKVFFKPASGISLPQKTVDCKGQPQIYSLPHTKRHDPCIAIRGVFVVKAVFAMVTFDFVLLNRLSKWEYGKRAKREKLPQLGV